MSYILGIDIGIASLGFSGIEKERILSRGVHIFEAAENPKDGASLAVPRREKRGLRRVIRRRAQRKKAIRRLFESHGFDCFQDIDMKFAPSGKNTPPLTPWDFRRCAVTGKVSDSELVRALFHIAAHRGFQSNRKGAEPNDTEGKKALSGAKELEVRMADSNARTIGEFLSNQKKKRNSDGSYANFVERKLLKEEVAIIFETQRKLGNAKATEKLQAEFEQIAFTQRPLQSSEHLVGTCALIDNEKRAPKFSYSAELFVAWSRLNNTKIRMINGEERFLTQDERQCILDKAHQNKTPLSFTGVRKLLNLHDNERFNISYLRLAKVEDTEEKIRVATEKAAFIVLTGYHTLKDALDTGSTMDWQNWLLQRSDALDDIARVISFYEDEKEIRSQLAKHTLSEQQIQKLMNITSFSKTVDVSVKAIRMILPHMQQGLTYDKACDAAGLQFNRKENKGLGLVPVFPDIRNPVVNRALAQARKVINAMIRKHGLPEIIIIELAREVGKPFKERKEIEREQKTNEAYRDDARKHAAELWGTLPENIRGEEILKHRLWKEQEGFCPYSGLYITPEMLRDGTATQIDHIIPYSRSWNDSYMNKVLCITSENQDKNNRTPFEYLHGTSRWDALETFAGKLPAKKRENLLIENFDETKAKEWKERALNDTRYMATLLKNHIEQSLPVKVQTRNGALTAHLRGAWGFPKKDRENDRHHAIDAIVLACSTQSMVQQLANWNKFEFKSKYPDKKPFPPKPWETFREDVLASVHGAKNEKGEREGGIFVSRMPVRKITGAAHQETIRSIRKDAFGNRQIIQRKKLTSLSKGDLENLVDKERNIKLYNVLAERLAQFGGDAKKAFAEPIYMPTNNPSKPAPRIMSVNIITNEKSGIEINGGLASNGDMVRVDVFKKNGKYFLVPIYVHQFAKGELPNRAIMQGKDESEWEVMDDKDFIFSLHKNEYVVIKTKKETIEGYYNSCDRATGNIALIAHDADPKFGIKKGKDFSKEKSSEKEKDTRLKKGIGVKTALSLEKYVVDYFGNKTLINKEVRCGVAHSDDSESD
jgi:CRISPR-associated endonuclease Csn1